MRIRQPDQSPPETIPDPCQTQQDPKDPKDPKDQRSKTYQVTTITPIFGGGVEAGVPDPEMPIRATAIRGQLRHWWRFLASHRKNDAIKERELFKQERALWGGMGEKNQGFASEVYIKVSNVKKHSIEPCYMYRENGVNEDGTPKFIEKFLHDIPPYALFSGKGKKPTERNNPPKPGEEPANVILSGLTFDLEVSFPSGRLTKNERQNVLEAVCWWGNFGGVGARTRRGLGSIAIDDITILTKEDVEEFGCKLKELDETGNAIKAWKNSIAKLQSFRQGENIGRCPGSDAAKPKKLGRSYWPEADTIRKLTIRDANGRHPPKNHSGTFPRAAFGLPIIFDFNAAPNAGEPPKTELSPVDHERMSSPLILKAQYIGKNKFLPIALLLPTTHLEQLQTKIKCLEDTNEQNIQKLLDKNSKRWWPKDQVTQQKLANDIEPLKGRSNNPLEAFMHFFSTNNK